VSSDITSKPPTRIAVILNTHSLNAIDNAEKSSEVVRTMRVLAEMLTNCVDPDWSQ